MNGDKETISVVDQSYVPILQSLHRRTGVAYRFEIKMSEPLYTYGIVY